MDHRLVRRQYLGRCDHSAWALYLFLVTVADAQGLSYYSDPALCRQLKLDPLQLPACRQQLQQAGLLAYQKPFYQVLGLEETEPTASLSPAPRTAQPQAVADILRRALTGGAA